MNWFSRQWFLEGRSCTLFTFVIFVFSPLCSLFSLLYLFVLLSPAVIILISFFFIASLSSLHPSPPCCLTGRVCCFYLRDIGSLPRARQWAQHVGTPGSCPFVILHVPLCKSQSTLRPLHSWSYTHTRSPNTTCLNIQTVASYSSYIESIYLCVVHGNEQR